MGFWAELDGGNLVTRVVVADTDPNGLLGGTWVETRDPYTPGPDVRVYSGPGFGHDASFPELFAEEWDATTATTPDSDGNYRWSTAGELCWHGGNMWKNTIVNQPNVWEPGVSGWHNVPVGDGLPQWVQPTGAHDAYKLGELVNHSSADWESLVADNVWEPGATGTETLWVQIPRIDGGEP